MITLLLLDRFFHAHPQLHLVVEVAVVRCETKVFIQAQIGFELAIFEK